jgi:hypothetical protein
LLLCQVLVKHTLINKGSVTHGEPDTTLAPLYN